MLPDVVGLRHALCMALTGAVLTVQDAHRLGLVAAVRALENLLPTALEAAIRAPGEDVAVAASRAWAAHLPGRRRVRSLPYRRPR